MILVVAGSARTRDALVPLIAARGYAVSAVDCGEEVLRHLRFRPAAAVVLDCGVPDSFEVLAKVRSEFRARSTPVIMFSTDDQDLKEMALLRGADAYVPKGSLDWVELLTEIRRFAGPPPQGPSRA